MAGPVITRASDVALELGISIARVKAVVKGLKMRYASDRHGDYLLPPNAAAVVASALMKPHTKSQKAAAAAHARAEKRRAKASTKKQGTATKA